MVVPSVSSPNHVIASVVQTGRITSPRKRPGEVCFKILKQTSPGLFRGEVILPVCTTDAMTWLGELTDGTTTVYPAIRMQR
ncbi:hypothetical protein HQK29_16385 [Vibrio vulnificus]|nr:hypothetical protein [Vibrio vulnificus]